MKPDTRQVDRQNDPEVWSEKSEAEYRLRQDNVYSACIAAGSSSTEAMAATNVAFGATRLNDSRVLISKEEHQALILLQQHVGRLQELAQEAEAAGNTEARNAYEKAAWIVSPIQE